MVETQLFLTGANGNVQFHTHYHFVQDFEEIKERKKNQFECYSWNVRQIALVTINPSFAPLNV